MLDDIPWIWCIISGLIFPKILYSLRYLGLITGVVVTVFFVPLYRAGSSFNMSGKLSKTLNNYCLSLSLKCDTLLESMCSLDHHKHVQISTDEDGLHGVYDEHDPNQPHKCEENIFQLL